MTLQEILRSLDDLSTQDQASLLRVLAQRLSPTEHREMVQGAADDGDRFWNGLMKFRETIEQEGLEFADEDFANLRDRSPGREIGL
jgi:hypothetical protein